MLEKVRKAFIVAAPPLGIFLVVLNIHWVATLLGVGLIVFALYVKWHRRYQRGDVAGIAYREKRGDGEGE